MDIVQYDHVIYDMSFSRRAQARSLPCLCPLQLAAGSVCLCHALPSDNPRRPFVYIQLKVNI